MNPQDRERVKELLAAAAGLASDQRRAFIEQNADNSAIAREAVDLLRTLDDSDFLAQVTGAGISRSRSADMQPAEGPGTQIGRYKLLQQIGEGGFGLVFMAEQTEPVLRRVALKIIKPGMDTRQVIARFEAERQALAMMDHPNIARVLDAGATAAGRPYFVMELVRGEPVTHYCDRQQLSVEERLSLFRDVCGAVQHAHQKGIIHRDIKPSNVLVTVADGRPLPKVIDFGIAKATAMKLTDKTLFTEMHQLIGTPQYMSPEQAEISGVDIDTRSDLYSLGVLLYELLAGEPPFDVQRMRSASLAEIQRIIRDEEPPRPSARLRTLVASSSMSLRSGSIERPPSSASSIEDIARRRRTEPVLLARSLRGDLDWIVMKCLEKHRARRYETAAALSDDIGRYLAREPVLATPPSAAYKLKKFVQRHRRAVLAGAAFGATLLTASVVAIGFAMQASSALKVAQNQTDLANAREKEAHDERLRAEQERVRAEVARDRAEEINRFVTRALVSSDPHQGGRQASLVTDAMEEAVALLDAGELKDQPQTEAALRLTIAEILNGNSRSQEALAQAERALEICEKQAPPDDLLVARGLNGVADCLLALGRTNDALNKFERALVGVRRHINGDHADVALGLNNVAICLDTLGRSEEALRTHRQALDMRQRLFSGDHSDVAVSLNNVAHCLEALGRPAEALPLFESGLAMHRRLRGGDHPSVATSLNKVASCLESLGRFSEALPYFEESLAMHQRLFKGDHPAVASSFNNLAGCLQLLGRPADALPLLEASKDMSQRLYPGDHPQVALGLNNLAACLQGLGRAADALPLLEAALSMQQRLLDGDHPEVAKGLNNVAMCLQSLGRLAEALPKAEAALDMWRRLFAGDHPDVALSLSSVATCLQYLGHSDAALPKFEASLEMTRRLHSGDHPDVARGMNNLAYCLMSLGRGAEALPLLEGALEMYGRLYEGDHPDTALSLDNLGQCLSSLGRPADALPKAKAALAMRQRLYEGAHPDVATSLNNVGHCLRSQGQFAEALQHLEAALAMLKELHPGGHPSVANCLYNVAVCQEALGRPTEALAQYEGSMDILRTMLPPGHPHALYPQLGIARSLVSLGRHSEAEALLMSADQQCEQSEASARLHRRTVVQLCVQLYDAWHAAEPEAGHDAKAARWRRELDAAAPATQPN